MYLRGTEAMCRRTDVLKEASATVIALRVTAAQGHPVQLVCVGGDGNVILAGAHAD